MIESNIIKRFIVKSFMQNNDQGLNKIADIIMDGLSNRFLLNESVYTVNSDVSGKISKCAKPIYRISTANGQEIDVEFDVIRRKMAVEHKDVCSFLEYITKETSLGRIVIENVFQKINEPGFGTPGYVEPARSQAEQRPQIFGNRHIPLRQKDSVIHVKKQIEASSSKPKTVEAKTSIKPQTINLENLDKFIILDGEPEQMVKLMTIYLFFKSFSNLLKIDDFSFEEMAAGLSDPDYSSKLIFNMHRILIDIIEKELKSHVVKLISDLDILFKTLPELEQEIPMQQTRKRTTLDLENWKSQVKIFLSNFSKESECDRILRFSDFAKKDEILLRTDFLIFLIKCLYYTETIKSMVTTGIEESKNEKQIFDQIYHLKRKSGTEAKEELAECNNKIRQIAKNNIFNPVRTFVGNYKEFKILFVDGNIILRKENEFYKAGQKEISIILKDLNTFSKYERSTLFNLKEIVSTLSIIN